MPVGPVQGGTLPEREAALETVEHAIKVLLIEADPSILEMYRLKLELEGYKVITAEDGEEGLKKAAEGEPELIFLDLQLPKVDGFEVLQQLRSRPSTQRVPLILLSHYTDEELEGRGFKLGAHEYLIKTKITPASFSKARGTLRNGTS